MVGKDEGVRDLGLTYEIVALVGVLANVGPSRHLVFEGQGLVWEEMATQVPSLRLIPAVHVTACVQLPLQQE